MADDSYSNYMYEAAKKREILLRKIKSLAIQIEGIDILFEHGDLKKREDTILLKKRQKLYEEREELISEFKKL
jgi:hypothetical protein